MGVQICGAVFIVAVICFEYRPIEAMGAPRAGFQMSGIFANPRIPPPRRTPTPDPWRMGLPQPFTDDPPTVEESVDLLEQGLKRDPCVEYCAQNVDKTMILKDCGDMVAAIKFLAENNHPRVKPECATARAHTCKYACFKGFSCQFTVTVTKGRGSNRKEKEKHYKIKHCLADNHAEIEMV